MLLFLLAVLDATHDGDRRIEARHSLPSRCTSVLLTLHLLRATDHHTQTYVDL